MTALCKVFLIMERSSAGTLRFLDAAQTEEGAKQKGRFLQRKGHGKGGSQLLLFPLTINDSHGDEVSNEFVEATINDGARPTISDSEKDTA